MKQPAHKEAEWETRTVVVITPGTYSSQTVIEPSEAFKRKLRRARKEQ